MQAHHEGKQSAGKHKKYCSNIKICCIINIKILNKVMSSMANIFIKRETCPTCNGEKTILCCSCTADEECHTIVCPSCSGAGEMVSYNTPAIVAAICVVAAVVVALVVL